MTKIYSGDLDDLRDEGWEIGAHWSEPGASGYYLCHPERHPESIQVQVTPAGHDSLREGDMYCGPSGQADSATDALLDRIEAEEFDVEPTGTVHDELEDA